MQLSSFVPRPQEKGCSPYPAEICAESTKEMMKEA